VSRPARVEEIFRDRARACSFGSDAEGYERARPSYPAEMIADLLLDRPGSVLDVGCGTGKAARLFSERGCAVLGVEPDSNMASVARRLGIPVETVAFEQWDPRDRRFDLVVSGQAWHWVDPVAGAKQLERVIRGRGRFAAFWNREDQQPKVREALDEVYGRLAPSLLETALASEPFADLRPLEESGHFEGTTTSTYTWQQDYSSDQWLDLIQTHSNHRLLDPATLASLQGGVRAALDHLGDVISVNYETTLISARAKAEPES
jgi:SAM-dependent methyltransferase